MRIVEELGDTHWERWSMGEGISFGEVEIGDCEEEGTCFWDGAE